MTELWRRLSGWDRLRLTGADPLESLRLLSGQMRLENLRWEDELSVCFTVGRRERKTAEQIAERRGDRLEVLASGGFPQLWKSACGAPILSVWLAVLIGVTCWLPGRIFFIEVEGNERLPAALILERAEQCGLSFGASRRKLRSEQVKNSLLHLVPELRWAGVNTKGCTAVLTVREREQAEEMPRRLTGSILAAKDGVVTSVTVTAGSAVCRVGQAVRKGEMLLSGVVDLGNGTYETAAEGEVFADTAAEIRAVLPRKTLRRAENEKSFRRLAILFGKKRINFYSDSGNLYPGCGKMVEVIPWVLPGGWKLPAALVVETYRAFGEVPRERPRREAEALLSEAVRRQVLEHAVAAEIRREELSLSMAGALWQTEGRVYCREMIGRTADGVYLEDDAKDVRTSGECGAG